MKLSRKSVTFGMITLLIINIIILITNIQFSRLNISLINILYVIGGILFVLGVGIILVSSTRSNDSHLLNMSNKELSFNSFTYWSFYMRDKKYLGLW